MKGRIAEIFQSIQGEGIFAGERQIFVRFYDCNLACKFCDTKLNDFKEYEPQELLTKLKAYDAPARTISFTGGEPLLQKDFLKDVLRLTRANGFRNYLETNGTLPDELGEIIGDLDIVAMDVKLPSSTGLDNFWGAHRRFLEVASKKMVFVKAVICQSTSVEDLRTAIKLIQEANKEAILVLQPEGSEDYLQLEDKLENFRNICRENNITACIIPQMHKVIVVK
jgi:organic radical activating enzyme